VLGSFANSTKLLVGREKLPREAGLDGYGWIKRATSLRGPDPEMKFAAALITFAGPQESFAPRRPVRPRLHHDQQTLPLQSRGHAAVCRGEAGAL